MSLLGEDEQLFYAIAGDDVATLRQLVSSPPGSSSSVDVDRVYAGACPINKSQWSLLHLCCYGGKYHCAKTLLDAGAYPDLPDKHGMTPLMYSVQLEWRHLVELFLEAGAQVNWQEKRGRTALHIGAETEDHRILDLLLEKANDAPDVNKWCLEGNTPLAVAVATDGHVTHVRHLISAGGDVNIPDVRNRRTPLQKAVLTCRHDLLTYVEILLDNGADTTNIDRFNHNVLMTIMTRLQKENSLKCPLLKAAEMIMQRSGANGDVVNARGTATRSIHYDGGAVHMAVENGENHILRLLLEQGADPNVTNSLKLTPLHYAVIHRNHNALALLLRYPCHLAATGSFIQDGRLLQGTPFRFALELGALQTALLLLERGHNLAVEEYIWNNDAHEAAPNVLYERPHFSEWIKHEFEAEVSLVRMCRARIRLAMVQFLAGMQKDMDCSGILPLPTRLMEFIILPDFV